MTRIGRWIDFDDDYKTMDTWYMESVWWVFKQLWDKGLIYQGVKVVPLSTALGTPLANFEATSNYQDVQDPAVTVLVKLREEDAYLAIWTTTLEPLPSNLAVCVGSTSIINSCRTVTAAFILQKSGLAITWVTRLKWSKK